MSFASENNPENTTPNLTLAGLEKWVAAWDPSRFSRNAKMQSLALQKRELAEQARDHLKFCYDILLLPNEATLDEAEELCRQNLQNWDASKFDGESRRAVIAEQKRIRFQDVLNRLNSARAAQQSLGDFGNTTSPTVQSLFNSGRSQESVNKQTVSQPAPEKEESSEISSTSVSVVSAGAGLTAVSLAGLQFPDPAPAPEAEDGGIKAHERFRRIREERKEAQESDLESHESFVSEVQSNQVSSESEDESWKTSETSEAVIESTEAPLEGVEEIEEKEVFSEVTADIAETAETVEFEVKAAPEPESDLKEELAAESEAEAVVTQEPEAESVTTAEPVNAEPAWIPPIPEIISSQKNQPETTVQADNSAEALAPAGGEEEEGPIFENPDDSQGTSLFERAILNLQSHQTNSDVSLESRETESALADGSQIESSSEFQADLPLSSHSEEIPGADEAPGYSTAAISEDFPLSDFQQSLEKKVSAQPEVSNEPLPPVELGDIFGQAGVHPSEIGSIPERDLPGESAAETIEPLPESYTGNDAALGMELDSSLFGGYEMEYAPPAGESEIQEPAYESAAGEDDATESAETEAWTDDYAPEENWTEGEFESSESQQVEFYEEQPQGDWAEAGSLEQNFQESEWDGGYAADTVPVSDNESYPEEYSTADDWNAQEESVDWHEEAPVADQLESDWDSTSEQQSSDYPQEVDGNEEWAADQGFDYQQDAGYGDEISETDEDVSVISEAGPDSDELEYEADQDFDESEVLADEYESEAVASVEGSEQSEDESVEEEYSEAARSGRLSNPLDAAARAPESSDEFLAEASDEEDDDEDLELFDEMAGMLDRPKRFQSKIMTVVGAIAVLFILGGSVAGYYYFSQQNTDIEALMEDGGELDSALAGDRAPSWQDPEDNIPLGNNSEPVTASQSILEVEETPEKPAMTAAEAYALGQQMENSGADGSIQRAMEAYEIAASQGMASAQFRLGTLYFEGSDGSPNYVKAAEWYRKAAEIGMPEAQFHLACMALHQPGGPGIVKDNPADWLRMASEQGYTNAKVNLALLYLDGAGTTPRDPNLAAYLLRQSADQGNPLGQALLGMMYDRGEGVLADSNQAMDWYQKAVEREPLENPMDLPGLPDVTRETSWEILRHAQKVLASKLLKTTDADSEKQVEQARKLLESAAETKDPQAQFQLGLLYCDAELADTDYSQAKKWFQEAADANFPPAWVNLGWMYENGFGVEKDYLKAEENYLKAVEAGDSLGQYRLGLLYLYGGEELPSDEVKAYHWIKAAAKSGAKEAVVKLEEWEKEMRESKSGVSPSAMEAWQILDSLESGETVSGSSGDYSELETASSAFNGFSIVSALKYL